MLLFMTVNIFPDCFACRLIKLFVGNSTSAPVIANITGTPALPANYYSSGVQALVNFVSDRDYSSTGFNMHWTTSAYLSTYTST